MWCFFNRFYLRQIKIHVCSGIHPHSKYTHIHLFADIALNMSIQYAESTSHPNERETVRQKKKTKSPHASKIHYKRMWQNHRLKYEACNISCVRHAELLFCCVPILMDFPFSFSTETLWILFAFHSLIESTSCVTYSAIHSSWLCSFAPITLIGVPISGCLNPSIIYHFVVAYAFLFIYLSSCVCHVLNVEK